MKNFALTYAALTLVLTAAASGCGGSETDTAGDNTKPFQFDAAGYNQGGGNAMGSGSTTGSSTGATTGNPGGGAGGETPPVNCGDGTINPGEECDGANLGGATCATATMGSSTTGTVTCLANCTFNLTGCTGGGVINPGAGGGVGAGGGTGAGGVTGAGGRRGRMN